MRRSFRRYSTLGRQFWGRSRSQGNMPKSMGKGGGGEERERENGIPPPPPFSIFRGGNSSWYFLLIFSFFSNVLIGSKFIFKGNVLDVWFFFCKNCNSQTLYFKTMCNLHWLNITCQDSLKCTVYPGFFMCHQICENWVNM